MKTHNLTEVERRILLCLNDGMNSEEIAQALDKSPNTINNEILSLRRTTGHNSRMALIVDYNKSMVNPRIIQDEIDWLDAMIKKHLAMVDVYKSLRQIKVNQLTR